MAPIKFEKNIREKLNKRTVQPSNVAWSKLSIQLDKESQSKDRNVFLYMGVAASIIAILFFVTTFYNSDFNDTGMPQVVEEPISKNSEVLKIVEHADSKTSNKQENINVLLKTRRKMLKLNADAIKENVSVAMVNTATAVRIEKDRVINTAVVDSATLTFEDRKILEIMAQVNTLQVAQEPVTDKTIEVLLQQAQREIALERMQHIKTGLVDANLLLERVEYELDESFRDKVFKALKDNLNKVKTAVAQRND